jgi:hypothetical protein
MSEIVLSYDHSHAAVTQETGYFCGPASSQIVLQGHGINVTENQLAQEMGTTTGGTASIESIAAGLSLHAAEAGWKAVWMPNDPPTADQREHMWRCIVQSIRGGWGCVLNLVVPPSNHPSHGVTKGSVAPNYGGNTVYHYVAAMGVDEAEGAVWIADSGFQPGGYWVTKDWACGAVTPHGFVWASNTPEVVAGAPEPAPAPNSPAAETNPAGIPCVIGRNGPKPYTAYTVDDKVSHTAHEVTMWLPARGLKDGLADVIGDPHRLDTTLGHSINAASLGRVNYEILVRLAAKLGVDLSDLV